MFSKKTKQISLILITTLVCVVLYLSIFENLFSLNNNGRGDRGTIIVNVSGGGDYTTIQAAVDAAEDGETILVEAGTYYENVVVNKSISLIGAGWDNTSIASSSYRDRDKILLTINADGVNVKDINFDGTGTAIFLDHSNSTNIMNNKCSNGLSVGIKLSNSHNNFISNNICSGNGGYAGENGWFGVGISLTRSNHNLIQNNICNSNSADTFQYTGSGCGIGLGYSTNNSVMNNTFSFNQGPGISCYANSNMFFNNTCNNNGGNYLFFTTNGAVINGDLNIIENNTFSKNCYSGLKLTGHWNRAENINFLNNFGHLDFGMGLVLSGSNNSILKNTIYRSDAYGINIERGSNNTICYNNLMNNNEDGIQAKDDGSNSSWDDGFEAGNYWSNWVSPDNNEDGIVDFPYFIDGGANARDYLPLTGSMFGF